MYEFCLCYFEWREEDRNESKGKEGGVILNNVTLVGNLTRDPAFFKSGDDNVAKFDLATKYGYDKEKKEERVEFVPITAFGIADTMKEYLKKGRKISIVGRVGTDSYEKEGQKVYSTTVKVSNGNLQFVDSKPKTEVVE